MLIMINDAEKSIIIGQNISEARKAKGISQVDLAKLLGVNKRTLSAYEKGVCRIPAPKLAEITTILKVSSDILLGVSDTNIDGRSIDARLAKKIAKLSDEENRSRILEESTCTTVRTGRIPIDLYRLSAFCFLLCFLTRGARAACWSSTLEHWHGTLEHRGHVYIPPRHRPALHARACTLLLLQLVCTLEWCHQLIYTEFNGSPPGDACPSTGNFAS